MSAPTLLPVEVAAVHRAVELAGRGAGSVLPNPVVGCVLLAPGGWTVGEGYHDRPGGPHAEVVALAAAGEWARGATAVVTLEPCNHTGRTGPCSEALVAAGVSRVIVAVADPWPPAAGGVDRLRAAGVDVVDLPALVNSGCPVDSLREAAVAVVSASEDVNRVWLTATREGRPFVTWKAGMTVDGRVAAPDGTSKWITSPESRADVHALRSRVDTMIVGVGTVLADDPQLTARDRDDGLVARQPLRVVLDSRGRTPAAARVLDASAESWVATAADVGADRQGRVDLLETLRQLYRRGQRHVLLEGGPTVTASFLDAGLIDEAIVYVAPTLLGAGRSALDGGAAGTLADAHRGELRDVARIGPDARLRFDFRR
ncbi:bifunctional diaminohydroxyphosphoribosylaminopyrimidine deaminase/5-amino-6-(5-phosphoribosylamino)uracil reductase RibD [Nakamurella sp. GG22]